MKIGKGSKDGKQFKSKEAERRYQAYKHLHPCKESNEERKSRLATEAKKEEEARQPYREHEHKQKEMIRRRESSGDRY